MALLKKGNSTAPFLLAKALSSYISSVSDMPSTLRILAVLGAALIAGAAVALESKKVANNNPPARNAHQGPAQEETAMQAMCREILVDTDEGYGVTNRESRVICDQFR